ncbi:hypothetical protein AVEN_64352-1 [Araneus ventricosus]|uniref:Uncharacterized protein n=1 Tax=Araneus ventricosus TaxID=182803 RepID=A0A4Y2D8X8_ARAVE|nr:hypothetical protein AVEN_64352-1 [Araneus ventricosus]
MNHTALPYHPGNQNDSRWNISSTEIGDIIAYHHATARPLPKAHHYYTPRGSEHPLAYSASGRKLISNFIKVFYLDYCGLVQIYIDVQKSGWAVITLRICPEMIFASTDLLQ